MPPVSKGRTVLVKLRYAGEPRLYNSEDEHPAIVTAVWGNESINARVLVDFEVSPLWECSIPHEDRAGPGYEGSTWRWPPKVEG